MRVADVLETMPWRVNGYPFPTWRVTLHTSSCQVNPPIVRQMQIHPRAGMEKSPRPFLPAGMFHFLDGSSPQACLAF